MRKSVCIMLVILMCITCLPFGSMAAKETSCTIYGRSFNRNVDYYTANISSTSYNPELSNMSAALSKAVYTQADAKSAYLSLGFKESDFVYNDYESDFEPYKCCHSIGIKKSDYSNDYICLVAIRGSRGNILSSDWIGNYSIVTTADGKHSGFSNSADYVYSCIKKMINEKGITGNIKYVITGHSRGAAIGNLLSVKFMENGVKYTDVYNYNFAIPNVAKKTSFGNYNNIFNLCNTEDPVPFLPENLEGALVGKGEIWGKFGRTYWFTKDAKGTVNPFYDHDMVLYLEFFDKQLNISEWNNASDNGNILNIENGWVVRINGTVDVVLTDMSGNELASVINGEVKYTYSSIGDFFVLTDGETKSFYIKGDMNFNIRVIGTKSNTISCSVEKYNFLTAEVLETKKFVNVKMQNKKELYCQVRAGKSASDVKLLVIESKNGGLISTHEVSTNGTEKELRHVYTSSVVSPTCTENGYTLHKCKYCEDSYTDTFVSAKGHNFKGTVCKRCGYDKVDDCDHLCHKTGFLGFAWKIVLFFCELLELDPVCDCGLAHY